MPILPMVDCSIGRRTDYDSGLMYFRARYYDPQLGEFISRDPLGYVDGMSLYRGYFAPGAVDPSGLDLIIPTIGTSSALDVLDNRFNSSDGSSSSGVVFTFDSSDGPSYSGDVSVTSGTITNSGRVRTPDGVFLVDYSFDYSFTCHSTQAEFKGPFKEEFNTVWRPETFGILVSGQETSYEIDLAVTSEPVDCGCGGKGTKISAEFSLVTTHVTWVGFDTSIGTLAIDIGAHTRWDVSTETTSQVIGSDSMTCCP